MKGGVAPHVTVSHGNMARKTLGKGDGEGTMALQKEELSIEMVAHFEMALLLLLTAVASAAMLLPVCCLCAVCAACVSAGMC